MSPVLCYLKCLVVLDYAAAHLLRSFVLGGLIVNVQHVCMKFNGGIGGIESTLEVSMAEVF